MFLKENKKKILILGSNGRLGSYLQTHLNKNIYDISTNPSPSDLSIKQNLNLLLDKFKPKIIINAIAFTDVNLCQSNVHKAFKSNTQVLKNISEIILEKKLDIFLIHISSDQIYSGLGPHIESGDYEPVNVYALTKYFAELYANKVKCCILRTNFFDFYNQKKHRSYINNLYDSLKKGEEVTGYKDIYFSPVHISSLFDLIDYICKYQITGTYNFGSEKGLSKYEFSVKLASYFNFDPKLIKKVSSVDFQNIERPKDMRLDCTKLKAKIRWEINHIENEISKIKY